MKTMTYDEIKEKLAYHDESGDDLDTLELGVFRTCFDPSGQPVVFMALIGTPPGGYAIFVAEFSRLLLYDKRGIPSDTFTVDEIVSDNMRE